MTEHLTSLFGSAVGMLPSSPARSFEIFSEITSMDETACDAWVGRIRCGDTDRVTLFRAWYSRANFGQLAGSAEISMNSVNARVPIGGQFGDITYPINSPLADHDGLRRPRGRGRQLRRCHGGVGGRSIHWRRAFGGVGEGSDLRRGRTLDRRHRRGQGRRRLAGQVSRRRRRCRTWCRGGQPGPVHRGRTAADRVELVAGRRGMCACDRVVSRDDATRPGQRRVGAGHCWSGCRRPIPSPKSLRR